MILWGESVLSTPRYPHKGAPTTRSHTQPSELAQVTSSPGARLDTSSLWETEKGEMLKGPRQVVPTLVHTDSKQETWKPASHDPFSSLL